MAAIVAMIDHVFDQYLAVWNEYHSCSQEMGGRLCTSKEISKDVTALTGCWFNMKRVWTSDSGMCSDGKAMSQVW